ncbi:MAG: toll/interleukin-1 receptor domain-containing protein, partial [Rhodospirillaceae bacterium]|nr:toll/interleukin-1 receptor domain-containing protein [Rhodospirillaceae bacterium]
MGRLGSLWRRLIGGRNSDRSAPPGFRYWAFISYSHRDEAWAKWLQRRIEGFKAPLPASDTGDGRGAAVRLFPLFRDEDEAPASDDLGRTLRDALAASRALIVVCSPAAAASKWVNEEIAAFRSTPEGKRVIAVVVDGEPFAAAPGKECFPPALRAPEPLAADLRKASGAKRQLQLMKVIAALTGLDLGELLKRDRRRRRARFAAVGALVGATAAAGGGLWLVERDKAVQQAEARLVEEYRGLVSEARARLRAGAPWDAIDRLLAKWPREDAAALLRDRVPALDATLRMALLKSRVEAAWPLMQEGRDLFRIPFSGLLPHPRKAVVAALTNSTGRG